MTIFYGSSAIIDNQFLDFCRFMITITAISDHLIKTNLAA